MAKERILVVDDDLHVLKALRTFLEHEGMQVFCAPSGTQGKEMVRDGEFDLVLLDLDLPDSDGLTILQEVRASQNTVPVMIISGHDEEYNKLIGLGMGADDFVSKPFSLPLLISKARALIRRANVYSRDSQGDLLSVGPFSLDLASLSITKDGAPIALTSKELQLMIFFMENPRRVLMKSQIYEAVWGNSIVDDNAVMVYVNRLRSKIEDDPAHPRYLTTQRGMGYRFDCS